MKTILFAGGDQRTLTAIEYMKRQGWEPRHYAVTQREFPKTDAVACLILPFPALKQGKLNAPLISDPPTLEELIRETRVDPQKIPAIGGPIPNNPFLRYTDLSEREDLKLRNAVTTTEGAVALLIENTPRSVFGMNVLLLGYGAIGTRLAQILHALGARVTVAARKEKDRVKASLLGYKTQDVTALDLRGFHALFNTVPVRILAERDLKGAPADLCYIELASAPGGCDPELLKAFRLNRIPGPALPGKVAPVTAGEDLAKTLIHILSSKK